MVKRPLVLFIFLVCFSLGLVPIYLLFLDASFILELLNISLQSTLFHLVSYFAYVDKLPCI